MMVYRIEDGTIKLLESSAHFGNFGIEKLEKAFCKNNPWNLRLGSRSVVTTFEN